MGYSLASREEYFKKVEKCDLIAIGQTISSDHQTSVNIADRFITSDYFFLLESATQGPGSVARYSYMGIGALTKILSNGDSVELVTSGGEKSFHKENPISFVSDYIASFELGFAGSRGPGLETDLFLSSGAAGYISYGLSSVLEPSIGEQPPKLLGLPDLFFFVPQSFLVFDQLSQSLHIFRFIRPIKGTKKDQLDQFEREKAELLSLTQELRGGHLPPQIEVLDEKFDITRFKSEIDEAEFNKRVEYCLNEIKKGEIFQIQIGNRISMKTDARPFDLFRQLRKLNPSPYMFFFKFLEDHLIGSSPEIMVNLDGRKITQRPIAGTRKRTWDPIKDTKMINELVTSEKERAEHIMLVDLGRNDVGRMAVPGTVKVEELMVVEKYSHVFHMVSEVTGKIEAGRSAADAMIASFPNGTVVGAPKIRAMQIIGELEGFDREFYAGSLGLFQFSGDLKSTILIRTMHVANGVASTQASAGVVYDSKAEEEWLETKNKMAACGQVIQNTL